MSGASIPALSQLADDEANFIYNAEILQLPVRKAAELAGMPASKIYDEHIKSLRELVRAELNSQVNISREDVVRGMSEAVNRARLLGEPMTEIIGWEKIAKLLGYDAPQKIEITSHSTMEVIQNNLRGLSDAELTKFLGAGNVIDADFYEIPAQKLISQG